MLMLDRRTLMRAGSATVGAAALAPTATAPALARAPQVVKAQPSFYRFKLGTIDITVVSDGTLAFPAETLWGDRAEEARGLLTSTSSPGGAANQHDSRQHWRQAGVDRRRLRRR
jgi:hypothetical protein